VLVVVGIAGAGPAAAAAKPRLPITLTAQPANPSPTNAAGFAWTTVAGATYTCVLDGAASTPCTSTASYSGLADGTHTFVLKGRLQGPTYRPGSKIVTWSVDTTPPGAPTVAQVGTPTSTTSALISFTNNDPTAVSHTCALDGATPVTCTSPWDTGTVAEGSHTVVVRSQDSFGVLGGSAPVTWVVDLTAPVDVLLTGPATPWASSTDFTFTATGATTYGCKLDAAASVPCTSPLHLIGLADGPHSLTVSASDGAGNTAQPAVALWNVDTTAPAAPTIVTGPANPTNQTTVDLVAGSLDGSSTLQCRLDSALPADWATCPTPLHWSGLFAGNHTIDLRAADAAGNQSTVVSVSWQIDLTKPAPAQFSGGPAAFSSDRLPGFDFFLTDSSASGFLCSLDAAPYVACDIDTVPLPPSPGLAEGPHVLQVESVDAASNASAPVSWSWTVDLTAPAAASFTATPAASTTETTARLVFSVETGAVLKCSVDGGPLGQCSSPYTLTGLALGAHSFAVTATDAAGNLGPASSYSWTVTAPVVSPPPPAPVPPTVTVPAAATTVTVSAARALLGRSTATFSADAHGVTAGIAPAVGIVTVACANAAGASVSCAAGPVRTVAVTHASPLVPGQRYTLTVSGTDVQARSVSGAQSFRASTDEQESSPATSYRWRAAASAKAYGRSYLIESGKGATATVAFRGTAITWFTMTGPAEGRAKVYVDGVKKAKVNNWSAATRWHVPRTVSGLKPGTHRLRIVVVGAKGSTAGFGTDIVFDAVKVGKKLLATPATVTTWRRVGTPVASGGSYTASARRGATASFAFRGTSLTWVTARGPAMGKAKVYVDGVLKTTVDNYAKRGGWNVRRTVTGLSDALHTVKVVVTGKRRASTGTTIVVDRWLVG
jgi:hypothetical protein